MKRRLQKLTTVMFGLSMVAGAFIACGGDDNANPVTTDAGTDGKTMDVAAADVSADTPALPGNITGNATYNGAVRGQSIYLGLFKGVPADFNDAASVDPLIAGIGLVMMPTLPGSSPYTIMSVPAGSYFLVALIEPYHPGPPTPPGPNTPFSLTPVTVTAGQTTMHDITIADPPPPDGGADAADASDG